VVCHRRQDGDRSASSLEKTLGYTFRPSIGRANLLISMLPLKKAQSPILMRCVITSPIKELSLRMSAQTYLNSDFITGSTGTWTSSNRLVGVVNQYGQFWAFNTGSFTLPNGAWNEWIMYVN
jgi:hypothetical protein